MAIVKCPECGHDVSDRATACPCCGATRTPKPTQTQAAVALLTLLGLAYTILSACLASSAVLVGLWSGAAVAVLCLGGGILRALAP